MLYIYITKMDLYQMKLSDIPSDVMEQLGSYLLKDDEKTIHKIFKDRKDDDLQVLLFGEVKDLTYVNIHDCHNEIDYEMNDKIKKFKKKYIEIHI